MTTETDETMRAEAKDAMYCMIDDYMRRLGCDVYRAVGIISHGLTEAMREYPARFEKGGGK